MKTIYHYDHAGILVGPAIADESPLEPGVFLIPALATDIVPPAVSAGQRARFDGSNWVIEAIPEPEPTPEPNAPSQEETIASYEAALDAHLDAVAQFHRYRDRITFALRAGYPGPWQAEGIAFGTWMDTCNQQALSLLNDVIAGTATLPTIADFITALPPFEKP